jgi:diguanylate cyclase (GGDEF)-like protein
MAEQLQLRARLHSYVAPFSASASLSQRIRLALGGAAFMVAVCGVISLIFAYRIAERAAFLTEVSSPLLIESMNLQRNADKMRAALFANDKFESSEQLLADLSILKQTGREHAHKFRKLAISANLHSDQEVLVRLQEDYGLTLNEIVAAKSRQIAAEKAIAGIYNKLRRVRSETDDFSFEIFLKLSQLNNLNLNNELYELFHSVSQSDHFHAQAIPITGEADADALKADIELFLLRLEKRLGILTGQFQAAGFHLPIDRIGKTIESLRTGFLGGDGLIASLRDLIAARAALTARSERLNEIHIRYADALAGIAAAVERQNRAAKADTALAVRTGLAAVLLVVISSTLLAVLGAAYLSHSVSLPLKRLTSHVHSMGELSDLPEITDPLVLNSSQELGQLAGAFNSMVREIASARQELIRNSEAEIKKQADRLEAAVSNMSQGLCMYDADQRLIVSNRRYAEIYGVPPERIKRGATLEEIRKLRLESGGFYGEPDTYVARSISRDTSTKPFNTVVELANGRVVRIVRRPLATGGWVATHEDITELRKIETKIAHMAHHDDLTSLPNRLLFRQRFQEALPKLPEGEMIAIHCLDLDRFKAVNDTLGHPIGDALLRAVTERLINCVRDNDTVARLGGDEFAIIQTGIKNERDAGVLAERIVKALSAPFMLDAHQVVIGCSVGIALVPRDGRDPDDLFKKADLALYRAKTDGRANYRYFEPEMDEAMQARRRLELDLRAALANGELELHYQPLFNVERNEITALEALVRWSHPERGLLAPAEFMPLAEEIGLIVPIGEWVVRRACRDALRWPDAIRVAVNLSPLQFKAQKVVPVVTAALADTGLPANRLELEITETAFLLDGANTLETLKKVKALGVRVSMDDFGTGYSSLSYLRSFSFDKIKIDRSFISDLGRNDECVAIVRAITGLGESLGMETIAEGVETREQLEKLRAEGCTTVQGYLISEPRPAADIDELLRLYSGKPHFPRPREVQSA